MSKEQREAKSTDILNALNEEQLKDLLRTEMMSDDTDVDLVKRINAVLNEKTARYSDCDIDEKWQEFVSEHSKSEPLNTVDIPLNNVETSQPVVLRKRKPLARAAIAAAIIIALLFGGTFTAQAFGYDIWEVLAQWTSEIFKFSSNSSPDNTASFYPETDAFDDLQAALDSYGVTDKLVPQYLPEGFEQVDFLIADNDGNLFLTSYYSNGTESIILKYSSSQGSQFQKDDGNPEIYEAGGIQHYIMTNVGSYKAVWINGQYEGSISGLESKDDLIKMIGSIYER